MNHQKIDNHPERISHIEQFINKYNWKDKDFLAGIKGWKNLNKITRKLLLISYMYHIIQKP